MSDESRNEERGGEPGIQPGAPEPALLRRGVFGYRRADVEQALETRDSDLAELRQDVAALWLAFAQHDRMIRDGLAGGGVAVPAEQPPSAEQPPAPKSEPLPEPEPSDDAAPAAESTESIGRQLSDLDEVLAAIEMATQTLERTYAEEIAAETEKPPHEEEPEPEKPAPEDEPARE